MPRRKEELALLCSIFSPWGVGRSIRYSPAEHENPDVSYLPTPSLLLLLSLVKFGTDAGCMSERKKFRGIARWQYSARR